jgi:hypothetical protein
MDDNQQQSTPPETAHAFESVESLAEFDEPSLGLVEMLGVLLLVVISDLTIYRGHGFAGLALLFAAAPALMWISSYRRGAGASCWVVGAMLILLAAKMVWLGSVLLALIGFVLLVAYAMALAGLRPYVPEIIFYAAQIIQSGYLGIITYFRSLGKLGPVIPRTVGISVLLPCVAFVAFGWLFVLANPDLVVTFSKGFRVFFETINEWFSTFFPEYSDLAFWLAAFWIVLGLLRPIHNRKAMESLPDESREAVSTEEQFDAFLYPACRNTILTLIALFAVYLAFEFQTLWFREIPSGFYYSGYAHEGAAWLTVALGLATVVLSLVFRGSILRDARLKKLRRLSWIWSLENLLLAVAVYNRLFIYVGFNGMTRMRIVGFYGITAVVIGFALVLWKIAGNRRFLWLVRRQLWTLAIFVYLFALTPLDSFVVKSNVQRILSGDPAPSVQISVHPIDSEGILSLLPLLECDNKIIREGVRALLAEHQQSAERLAAERNQLGWTTYQLADRKSLVQLRLNAEKWKHYKNSADRAGALERFHEYAFQWY